MERGRDSRAQSLCPVLLFSNQSSTGGACMDYFARWFFITFGIGCGVGAAAFVFAFAVSVAHKLFD